MATLGHEAPALEAPARSAAARPRVARRLLRRLTGHRNLPALGLFLLGPAAYHRALAAGQTIADWDYVVYFLPYRSYLAEAWRQGRWLPLWNPHIYLGAPFLANIQAAALYPPNLLLLALPPVSALAWMVALHTGLAGAGLYLYGVHGLRLGRAGSLVSGLVYMLGTLLFSHAGQINQLETLAWAPWLMLTADRAALAPRPGRLAAVALVVALVIAAGHTQQAYFSFLLAAIAAGIRLWGIAVRRRLWRRALRTALLLGGSVALGAGMMALQLAATLELTRQSVRSGGLSLADAGANGLPLSGFLGDLLPNYVGEHRAEFASSVGAAALLLIALALATRWRRPRVGLWALLGLVALAVAFGTKGGVYDLLYVALPGLSLFRVPSRALLFTTVAAAVLAGEGVRSAGQLALAVRRRRLRPGVVRAVAGAGVLAAVPILAQVGGLALTGPPRGVEHFLLRTIQPVEPRNLLLLAGFEAAAGVAVLTALLWRRLAVGLLPLLVLADLILLAAPTYPLNPLPATFLNASAGSASLVPHSLDERSLTLAPPPSAATRYAYYQTLVESRAPDLSMVDGTLDADGYDGGILPLRTYVDFREPILNPGAGNPPDFTDRLLTEQVHDPTWLARAAVAVVVSPAGTDPNPAGGQDLVPVASSGAYVAWRPVAGIVSRAHMDSGTPAAVVSDSGETVVVRLPQGASGRLVLADAYYPGWTATVDGVATPVERYDGYLRAVQIPAGAHEVVFSYQPRWVLPAGVVALLALLATLGLAGLGLARRLTRL